MNTVYHRVKDRSYMYANAGESKAHAQQAAEQSKGTLVAHEGEDGDWEIVAKDGDDDGKRKAKR